MKLHCRKEQRNQLITPIFVLQGDYTPAMSVPLFTTPPGRRLCLVLMTLCLGLGQTACASTPRPPAQTPTPIVQSPQSAKSRPGKAPARAAPRAKPKAEAWPEARATRTYASHAGAEALAVLLAEQHGMDPLRLRSTLASAHFLPTVQQLVLPPATVQAKNWGLYRSRFIEPRRIQAGVHFWQKHQQDLLRAEQTFGVPAAIVVSIIGVETMFGQNTGRFRVLDALATLAFDFPASHPRAQERQHFFRQELGHFLRMTLSAGIDPQQIRGSYAGAMGLPQFMPSSWVRHAIDFDGDGRIDLFNSPSDAIGSVANYFRAHQWQPGQPTHFPVSIVPGQTDLDGLLAPDILPTFSPSAFEARGAVLDQSARHYSSALALVELRNGDQAPSYVAGTDNFYAITRYNWSSYYAMAVIELAAALESAINNTSPSRPVSAINRP
jgi:membrane-bound lytic murein transglycosylase B